ncbi:I78 family peptidase inhibitor [Streptomyces sp. UNOC14_S4]|uniref:I78 family peptidase inhibitor n=1 Tax=Streptomyces sp. UNOC14_S4 TaxID=2872340 RepID=UPI001E58D50F|nr:I78 family peptidase inhibitor [Streptomyces sp. UNOC14_S4]MCC3770822.1 proteinase inhibitor I78 [Streptomyces sp. UNOC14_S4]
MAPLPNNVPADPDDDPGNYVGLAAERAAERARARGWATVRALAPGTMITMEYRASRLNFEVEGGVVRRCWKG